LRAAFPGAPELLVEPLAAAALDLFVLPVQEELSRVNAAPDQAHAVYPSYYSAETLIRLTGERDKLTEQVTRMEAAMEKIAQSAPGMEEVFRATALPMIQQQLDRIDREISEVQQGLEQQQTKAQEEHEK
jgi:hypothetical protein